MTLRRAITLAALAGMLLAQAAAARAEPPACPPVAIPPIRAPAMAEALARGEAIRIVALGSSSTEGAGASAPERTYPAVLEARLRQALPGVAVTVLNRGVGGEDIASMIRRIDRAVIAERPQLVIWQAGANATLRRMPAETFRGHLMEGLARLRQAGIDVVLMDNQRAPRIRLRAGPDGPDQVLAEVSAGMPWLSLFSRGRLMDAWAEAGVPPAALITSDGLHHNDRGYACIAEALATALLEGLHLTSRIARRPPDPAPP